MGTSLDLELHARIMLYFHLSEVAIEMYKRNAEMSKIILAKEFRSKSRV
jgi:hypothetical protein